MFNRRSTCSCTEGYFDNLVKQSVVCDKCHESCATCSSGSSRYQCDSCKEDRNKDKDSTGLCACHQNFSDQNGKCVC